MHTVPTPNAVLQPHALDMRKKETVQSLSPGPKAIHAARAVIKAIRHNITREKALGDRLACSATAVPASTQQAQALKAIQAGARSAAGWACTNQAATTPAQATAAPHKRLVADGRSSSFRYFILVGTVGRLFFLTTPHKQPLFAHPKKGPAHLRNRRLTFVHASAKYAEFFGVATSGSIHFVQ